MYKHSLYIMMLDGEEGAYRGHFCVEYVCVNKIDPIDEGINNYGAGFFRRTYLFA